MSVADDILKDLQGGIAKTLEDLKMVPGVDFRKINRRRDRLVCI